MRCYRPAMTLKAHVHNGRLVVDEPTELPEGTEVAIGIKKRERLLIGSEEVEL